MATSSSDGLPKSFISAMKTLFDIMDDQNTGFIKFSDIKERWQDDGAQVMNFKFLKFLNCQVLDYKKELYFKMLNKNNYNIIYYFNFLAV